MDIEKICASLRVLPTTEELLTAEKALYALQAENEKLREMYQKEKAVCHAVQAELEQVKRERGAAIEAANGLDKMIGRAWGED